MSLDLFCASLNLKNASYNTSRLNTCVFGLVGHKDRAGVIVKGGSSKIGYKY